MIIFRVRPLLNMESRYNYAHCALQEPCCSEQCQCTYQFRVTRYHPNRMCNQLCMTFQTALSCYCSISAADCVLHASARTFRCQTTKGLDRGSLRVPISNGNGRNIKGVKACRSADTINQHFTASMSFLDRAPRLPSG